MNGKIFKHSFISEGKFLTAGVPIEEKDIRPFMLKYEAKEERPTSRREINLRRQLGERYYVDGEGRMTVPARRAAAEMEAINAEKDYIDEVSMEPPDPATEAMLDEMREDHAADMQRRKMAMQVAAEHADQMDDAIRQEQDEKVEAGEYNEIDVEPPPKPKRPIIGGQKLFVKRNGKFVQAHDVELIIGEALYRYRKRELGKSAMFIKCQTVKGNRNEIQTS